MHQITPKLIINRMNLVNFGVLVPWWQIGAFRRGLIIEY